MTDSPAPPTPNLSWTARTPEDLLAVVPLVLGFVPTESVVMLTFGGPQPFQARIDLPPDEALDEAAAAALLEPALRHQVRRVVLVAYASDVARGERSTDRVRALLHREGIETLARIVADGRHWWALPRRPGEPGTAYDVTAHRFAAEAVVEGVVTHSSRAALAATLDADPVASAAVASALVGVRPPAPAERAAEVAWATHLVRRWTGEDRRIGGPDPGDTARLLVALLDVEVRDAVCFGVARRTARAHVGFWTAVLRRSPAAHRAGPALALGLAAWLSGHGALAWCALDHARAAEPASSLADLIGELLLRAVPPSAWEELLDGRGPGRPA